MKNNRVSLSSECTTFKRVLNGHLNDFVVRLALARDLDEDLRRHPRDFRFTYDA